MKTLILRILVGLIFSSQLLSTAYAEPSTSEQKPATINDTLANIAQRKLFADSYQALRKGHDDVFEQNLPHLKNYVLEPYAHYFLLEKRLSDTKVGDANLYSDVSKFIADNSSLPIIGNLRRKWLFHLGKNGQWARYKKAYTKQNSTTLQCYWLHARIFTKEDENKKLKKDIIKHAKQLWSSGRSQPDSCDTVFIWLKNAGGIDDDLLVSRTEKALLANNTRLASWLSMQLSEPRFKEIKQWFKIDEDPEFVLYSSKFKEEKYTAKLVEHAVKRIAREDADKAQRRLQLIRSKVKNWSDETLESLHEFVAIRLALQGKSNALPYARQSFAAKASNAMAEWWLRALIEKQAWDKLATAADTINKKLPDNRMVQFWYAEALARQGKTEASKTAFGKLSNKADFYGLLASDKLKQAYPIKLDNTPVASAKDIKALKTIPHLQRAQELLKLDLHWLARAEWYQATKLPEVKKQRHARAALAKEWNWPSRMIHSAKVSPIPESEFYPLGWKNHVTAYSGNDLDRAWVLGLMRQESLFKPDIRSGAGAVGLMQLIPSTGKRTAKKHGLDWNGLDTLIDPVQNIQLGTSHLKDLMELYNRNIVKTTAAYNAGKNAVAKWQAADSSDALAWIELIPYKETRNYVKKVLTNAVIYQYKLNADKGKRLTHYLQPQVANTKLAKND